MGNWGDDKDEEVKALKEFKPRFTVNFKKIFVDVDLITETTLEITDKHPKDSLMLLFAGTMTAFFVLFVLSYQVAILATVPFMAFYLVALLRIGKAWKTFKYNGTQFVLMSIGCLAVLFAIAMTIQHFAFN